MHSKRIEVIISRYWRIGYFIRYAHYLSSGCYSIQDSTYQSIGASKIPVLWIDHDQDSISFHVKKELEASQSFTLVSTLNNQPLTENLAKTQVLKALIK